MKFLKPEYIIKILTAGLAMLGSPKNKIKVLENFDIFSNRQGQVGELTNIPTDESHTIIMGCKTHEIKCFIGKVKNLDDGYFDIYGIPQKIDIKDFDIANEMGFKSIGNRIFDICLLSEYFNQDHIRKYFYYYNNMITNTIVEFCNKIGIDRSNLTKKYHDEETFYKMGVYADVRKAIMNFGILICRSEEKSLCSNDTTSALKLFYHVTEGWVESETINKLVPLRLFVTGKSVNSNEDPGDLTHSTITFVP